MSRALALGALGLTLAACPPTPPANGDSGVDASVDCSGNIGCACVNGTCNTGECVGGTCTDCRRGEAACICRSNDTCNTGLRCTSGRCVTCPPGEQNCACGTGDTCNTGLACSNGTCVPDTCTAGTQNCPCLQMDPKCQGDAYCDTSSVCRMCTNEIPGCACVNGACAGMAVCDTSSMKCRLPLTCAQLVANGQCGANQVCNEPSGADATCVAGQCKPQFKWDGTACVACVSLDCANEPSCTADGGLATTCAAQNRTCVQNGNVAACGACLPGYASNGSICQPAPTCGSVTCGAGEYCDTLGVPTCRTLPCDAGTAINGNGNCAACSTTPNCSTAGFSGRIWPYMSGDQCICETLDNYYFAPGGSGGAIPCDADNDGWVRVEADTVAQGGTPAVRANVRCKFQKVNRVRLVDEYGMSIDVLSCNTGMVRASTPPALLGILDGGTRNASGSLVMFADAGLATLPDGGDGCNGFMTMTLLETLRNDEPGRAQINGVPAYVGSIGPGRNLQANELNGLTKYCVSPTADFNDNGKADLTERQAVANMGDPRDRLQSFSYFAELYSATVEGSALVIRERSRCAPGFPLHYDTAATAANRIDEYNKNNDTPYWRNCSRGRDPDYMTVSTDPGFDFAQYACDQSMGTCEIIPPPHPTLSPWNDFNQVYMRDHGLCELDGGLPADRRWRGLMHHSQFKCVNVITQGTTKMNAAERLPSEFGVGPGLEMFNTCQARACDAGVCSTPTGTGAQPYQPIIDCNALSSPPTNSASVGWAAVNYTGYRTDAVANVDAGYPVTAYQGGCINEDDISAGYLCPYPQFNLTRTRNEANFGRYSCYGDGTNFLWAADAGMMTNSVMRWGSPTSNGAVLR